METLIKIQSELKCPKGNINAFGKYKYRSAEDILEAAKPVLKKNNAFVTLTDKIEEVGNKIFLCATATIFIGEKSLSTNGFAELSEHKGMSSEQCTGTASSYARKYALNGLFLIDETEQDANSQKPQSNDKQTFTIESATQKLKDCKTLAELQDVYLSLPASYKTALNTLKDELKMNLK